jgi:hypothetical protein
MAHHLIFAAPQKFVAIEASSKPLHSSSISDIHPRALRNPQRFDTISRSCPVGDVL